MEISESNLVRLMRDEIGNVSKENGLKTMDVRKVSAKIFRNLPSKEIGTVLHYCEILLEEKNWELGVVAYDWAYRMKKQYTEEIFIQFESWLCQYVTGWGDCDDFCTHAFGELLIQYPQFYEKLFVWCKSEKFWVRRAAAVILILPIKKGKSSVMEPLKIADELMMDSHDLVQKGYGWMLKMYSMQEKERVMEYLDKNRYCMPRTAFRYALEKLDPEERKSLMT